MALWLLVIFLALILIGVPIGFSMGLATVAAFITLGGAMEIIPTKMITGIDNFTFFVHPPVCARQRDHVRNGDHQADCVFL